MKLTTQRIKMAAASIGVVLCLLVLPSCMSDAQFEQLQSRATDAQEFIDATDESINDLQAEVDSLNSELATQLATIDAQIAENTSKAERLDREGRAAEADQVRSAIHSLNTTKLMTQAASDTIIDQASDKIAELVEAKGPVKEEADAILAKLRNADSQQEFWTNMAGTIANWALPGSGTLVVGLGAWGARNRHRFGSLVKNIDKAKTSGDPSHVVLNRDEFAKRNARSGLEPAINAVREAA